MRRRQTAESVCVHRYMQVLRATTQREVDAAAKSEQRAAAAEQRVRHPWGGDALLLSAMLLENRNPLSAWRKR
jgi:hypothetical protein